MNDVRRSARVLSNHRDDAQREETPRGQLSDESLPIQPVPLAVREIRAFHKSTASGIDIGDQFVVESGMTIHQRTGRYIFLVSVFMSVLQTPAATAQNKKGGVTVSYESSGSSRVARFKNSNSYHVRVEFSYSGTRVHGSAEASGQDAVFVPANYSATYGGQGISITSVRITRVIRSD
jgi:hypothetical protein